MYVTTLSLFLHIPYNKTDMLSHLIKTTYTGYLWVSVTQSLCNSVANNLDAENTHFFGRMVILGPSVFYLFGRSVTFSAVQFSIFCPFGFGLPDQLETISSVWIVSMVWTQYWLDHLKMVGNPEISKRKSKNFPCLILKVNQCCQIWCNYTNLVYLDSNLWGKFSSGVILFLVELLVYLNKV